MNNNNPFILYFVKTKMKYRVQIAFVPKSNIVDAQGRVVKEAMLRLGYNNTQEVSIGRFMSYETDVRDEVSARQQAQEIGPRLKQFHVEDVKVISVKPVEERV